MFSVEAYYPQTSEVPEIQTGEEIEGDNQYYPEPPVTLLTSKTIERAFAGPLRINVYYGIIPRGPSLVN